MSTVNVYKSQCCFELPTVGVRAEILSDYSIPAGLVQKFIKLGTFEHGTVRQARMLLLGWTQPGSTNAAVAVMSCL